MQPAATLCWICGSPADSYEHKSKKTDIKAGVGTPSVADPIYMHTEARKNIKIISLKSDWLTADTPICRYCNNTRTQSHDYAWTKALAFFQASSSFLPGRIVKAKDIFPRETEKQMLNLHLYAVKAFGSVVMDGSLKLDIGTFANAIMNGTAHPDLRLRFGVLPDLDPRIGVFMSPPIVDGRAGEKYHDGVAWTYGVGKVAVNLMYSIPGVKRDCLVDSWHPVSGRMLKIGDLS